MAILVKCPGCRGLKSLRNDKCPKCNFNLKKARKNKQILYYASLFIQSLKKYKYEPYEKLADAQKAEREFKNIKDENEDDSIIILNEKTTVEKLLEWHLSRRSVQKQAQFKSGVLQPKVKLLNTHLRSIPISYLKKSMLEDFQTILLEDEPTHSPSYTDQTVGLLKTAINNAIDDDLLLMSAAKPFRKLKKALKRKKDNARTRILSAREYEDLLPVLPPHLRTVFIMGYHTGMRLGEMLNLTWDRISMKKRLIRLQASDTKEKQPRDIPMADVVYNELENLPRGLHTNHVILADGEPVDKRRQVYKDVKRACDKVGIIYGQRVVGGFTPHDLRHTFITNARKAGVPKSVIMKITGHSTSEMFFRYDNVDEEDVATAMAQFVNFVGQQKIISKKAM